MSRLFISYRRKSWPFTHRLADELRQQLDAEIFVDFSGIDETDFERAILRNLRDSDAVLLVVSEYTFVDRIHRDDDWVRREIREALVAEKRLILICVDGLLPPAGLPEDIKDVARMQGIPFYPEYFTSAVERLAEFIVKVGAASLRTAPAIPAPVTPASDEKRIGGRASLEEALDLLQAGDFHKAIFLLESLQQAGYTSRYVDIAAVLEQARQDAVQAERRRQAALDYDEIAAFARRRVTEEHARTAFAAWCNDYPDLVDDIDTEHLRARFNFVFPASTRLESEPEGEVSAEVRAILPPSIEWIEIPAGQVMLEDGEGMFKVPAFMIAKYPITNAQYATFVEAGGYQEKKWWTVAGWHQREKDNWLEPRYWRHEKWNGADYPVVGVSWYEAMAFCRWLTACLNSIDSSCSEGEVAGVKVMLPTEQQWQRTAQGDDERTYPWGNEEPNESRCNFGQRVGHTTPVTQYPLGASPYGVMDMSGNVWEWCLNEYHDPQKVDLEGDAVRCARGGSWYFDYLVSLLAATRYWFYPWFWYGYLGFRVVLSAPR